jgi:hypothetical protein
VTGTDDSRAAKSHEGDHTNIKPVATPVTADNVLLHHPPFSGSQSPRRRTVVVRPPFSGASSSSTSWLAEQFRGTIPFVTAI